MELSGDQLHVDLVSAALFPDTPSSQEAQRQQPNQEVMTNLTDSQQHITPSPTRLAAVKTRAAPVHLDMSSYSSLYIW